MNMGLMCGTITCCLLWAVSLAAVDLPLQEDVRVANPSFEEDMENDGVPDAWEIPGATRVTLVPGASHGAKAAAFSDGYVLAAQNFQLRALGGRTLVVRLDVRGTDGAAFGCQVGYFRQRPDGTKAFVYSRLAWDRPTQEVFERVTMRCQFPETAQDGRLWLAFYRSNRQGRIWLDHVEATAQNLEPEQQLARTRLAREYRYLGKRAEQAAARAPEAQSELQRLADRASRQVEVMRDATAAQLQEEAALYEEIARGHARINATAGDGRLGLRWAPACERLEPDAPPATGEWVPTPVVLRAEVLGLGIDLLNPTDQPLPLTIHVDAAPGFSEQRCLRRQVFMETWYKKAETRLADPLPRLPQDDAGRWMLSLEPGGRERLYLHLESRSDAAPRQAVRVQAAGPDGLLRSLTCVVTVLPLAVPASPRFEHIQFMYPDLEPARSHPEAVARDLGAHHVSGIEFPYLPEVTFHRDGSLASTDFPGSPQARWMHIYGRHVQRLMLFWEGRYKRFPIADSEGEFLAYTDDEGALTPEFRRAYVELLRAWLEYARSEGFGSDRFLMLADDEPSSKEDVAAAPGREVRRTLELYRLTREAAAQLPLTVTLSDYATPPDVEFMAPAVDAVMPLWPYRERLTRWVPPDYRPRDAFWNTIQPFLERLRQTQGLAVWSYRVDAGKSEPVLSSARAYPVIAVGAGFSGIATWAYNVSRGLSWDDTDGGLLDYVFIYDGTEAHPLNRQVNPTGEIVVPSIRWEALRLGWQDAQVLTVLQHQVRSGDEAAQQRQVEELLQEPAGWAREPETVTLEAVEQLGARARRLLAQVFAE